MKRKLMYFLLCLTMLFSAGCNKKEEKPVSTPATATPAPVPENLAKKNLNQLLSAFDALMASPSGNTWDIEQGIGCDLTLSLSLGQQIAELLGLSDLETIRLSGTVDTKETLAANLSLYLNSSEVVKTHVFMDSSQLLFNLPKYSSSYAQLPLEDLLDSISADAPSLLGSTTGLTSTLYSLPASDTERISRLREHLENLIACFQEVKEVTPDVSIGTGDYTLTGSKYTVKADTAQLFSVLENLESELAAWNPEIDFNLDEQTTSKADFVFLDYYTNESGSYAWSCYPDTTPDQPIVFIHTDHGFCLYHTEENGTTVLLCYSVKKTETSGTLYLPSQEDTVWDEEPAVSIEYEYDDNSLHADIALDTLELSINYSMAAEVIAYDVTIASFGAEYATFSVLLTARDYVEIPLPSNTISLDTWAETLDDAALTADLMQLFMSYPSLANLILGLGAQGDGTIDEETPFVPGDDYHDDFQAMTGYTIDAEGYVDFYPLESEVLAVGKPSTGLDTITISEEQKQSLFTIAESAIPGCQKNTDTYYNVWGSAQYNDVKSYYITEYDFTDSNSYDNNIIFTFDAVSGAFSSVDIYHSSPEEAFRIANELFQVLGGTNTITREMAEDYTYAEDFAFSGYDASPYGENYYNVTISVFFLE